jgi:hypothetical protein
MCGGARGLYACTKGGLVEVLAEGMGEQTDGYVWKPNSSGGCKEYIYGIYDDDEGLRLRWGGGSAEWAARRRRWENGTFRALRNREKPRVLFN